MSQSGTLRAASRPPAVMNVQFVRLRDVSPSPAGKCPSRWHLARDWISADAVPSPKHRMQRRNLMKGVDVCVRGARLSTSPAPCTPQISGVHWQSPVFPTEFVGDPWQFYEGRMFDARVRLTLALCPVPLAFRSEEPFMDFDSRASDPVELHYGTLSGPH